MADIIIIGWARVREANYQTRKMLEHWSGGASMKKKERGKKWDRKKKEWEKRREVPVRESSPRPLGLRTPKSVAIVSPHAHMHICDQTSRIYIYISQISIVMTWMCLRSLRQSWRYIAANFWDCTWSCTCDSGSKVIVFAASAKLK